MVTIQKPTDEDWTRIRDEPAGFKCFAPEVGSKTNNYHVHVWGNNGGTKAVAYLKGPWDGVDKNTGEPKHKDYNPQFEEFGDMKQQGQRTDFISAMKLVRAGTMLPQHYHAEAILWEKERAGNY